MVRYFFLDPWLVSAMCLIVGCFVLVVEVVISFLQAYVFCILLEVYRNDHSL